MGKCGEVDVKSSAPDRDEACTKMREQMKSLKLPVERIETFPLHADFEEMADLIKTADNKKDIEKFVGACDDLCVCNPGYSVLFILVSRILYVVLSFSRELSVSLRTRIRSFASTE